MLHDFLSDEEAETNSFSVEFLWWLHEAIQLKEFAHIFFFDSDTCVFNLDFKEWSVLSFKQLNKLRLLKAEFITIFDDFILYRNEAASRSELYGIWH